MTEAEQIINFLDQTITAGADKAYITPEEYALAATINSFRWDFRKMAYKKYIKGKYKGRLLVIVQQEKK